MKTLLLVFSLFFIVLSAQTADELAVIVRNEGQSYEGKINGKEILRVKFDAVSGVSSKPQDLTLSGEMEKNSVAVKFHGEAKFNSIMTKTMRDKTITVYEIVLRNSENKDEILFGGDMVLKSMPKLFNLIVFEGEWMNNDEKLKAYFDNSAQLMNGLQSLDNN